MIHFATIRNPKTGENIRCLMCMGREDTWRRGVPTYCEVLVELEGAAHSHFARGEVHVPGDCAENPRCDVNTSEGANVRRVGLGASLYMALALAAERLCPGAYIYSREGYCSSSAERLWMRLVSHRVATVHSWSHNESAVYILRARAVRDTGLVVWEDRK